MHPFLTFAVADRTSSILDRLFIMDQHTNSLVLPSVKLKNTNYTFSFQTVSSGGAPSFPVMKRWHSVVYSTFGFHYKSSLPL